MQSARGGGYPTLHSAGVAVTVSRSSVTLSCPARDARVCATARACVRRWDERSSQRSRRRRRSDVARPSSRPTRGDESPCVVTPLSRALLDRSSAQGRADARSLRAIMSQLAPRRVVVLPSDGCVAASTQQLEVRNARGGGGGSCARVARGGREVETSRAAPIERTAAESNRRFFRARARHQRAMRTTREVAHTDLARIARKGEDRTAGSHLGEPTTPTPVRPCGLAHRRVARRTRAARSASRRCSRRRSPSAST